MFLLHERKSVDIHRDLVKECVKQIPALKKTKCPLVTNREKAILNAADSEVPHLPVFHCWNHIFWDFRQWLHNHRAPAQDITIYSDDVFHLSHQPDNSAYTAVMKECSKSWDAQFQEYFKKQIHPDFDTHIDRWVLERYNSYNPYSGVTNNQSESLNRVIKDLQHWKEAPLTACSLLLQLQAYYINKIK